jgi:site-specific DNA recombinase
VLSTKVPDGYRRVPRTADRPAHLIIHEPEANVVRRIFADFLAGHSLRHLAVALSADGILSPEGKPVWRLSTICRILRSEAYAGRLHWNRTHTGYDPALGRDRQTPRPREEWIEIPIPAIIDQSTLDAADAKARDNSSDSPRRTEPDTFLLRRLLRCAHCGVKLSCRRAHRRGTTTRYYFCPHRDPWRAGGANRRCPERQVRADELDTFVFDQVHRLLARPDLLTAAESALAGQTPAADDELLATQLARLQRRLIASRTEQGRVADLYQAGVIDNAEMRRRFREIDARARRIEQEQQSLLTRQTELAADNRLQHGITDFAQRALRGIDTLDFAQRQQLLRLVLDDVRVQGWNVELRLRIPLDDNPPTDPGTRAPHTRTRATTPSPKNAERAKEPVSSNDRLRSIGELTQERAQRRRRICRVEDPAHPTVAQQRHVLDAVGAGHHPRHQRGHLQPGIRTPIGRNRQPLLGQRAKPRALRQREHRHQPSGRHQIRLIEHRRHRTSRVRQLHLPDALSSRPGWTLSKSDPPATKGHSGSTTRSHRRPHRWIRA